MKIVVVGGGYAGLSCLSELHRRVRDARLVLVDPAADHFKITHLHESVRRPLAAFRVPFSDLGRRMGFTHRRGRALLDDIDSIAGAGSLDIESETGIFTLDFDYLVIATGSRPPALPSGPGVYDRNDLLQQDASGLVKSYLDNCPSTPGLTVVGGGPSGIQMLFELADLCRRRSPAVPLRLVDRDASLLTGYPAAIGDYVSQKIAAADIDFRPACEYLGVDGDSLQLRCNGTEISEPAGLTFLFPGAQPAPFAVATDRFGRVGGRDNVMSAGDCARYDSRGDDGMTAQVAVRQGKHVATNIDRVSRGVRPLEYFFRELGYVISLGPLDAVGWLLVKDRVVHGLPAFAIKEAVEAQYDLFVAGLDTYVI